MNKNIKEKKNEEILKIIVYTIAIITTIIYIVYRIFFTLPTKYGLINLIFGIVVLLIEVIESIDFIVYYINVLCFNKKSPNIPKIKKTDYPDVDVFIATINESEDLVENTIKSCLAMKYPSKDKVHIFLCDDGNRANMKMLCDKYNIGYITRDNNMHAKAGNYNNALRKTNSPLIATFDADMKPTPYFLLKTVPFFVKYNNIGFVQLPQSFNNPDIFQLRFKLYDKIPFEQDYFYRRIQMAKNKINTVIYCGTNAVISRDALNSVNGFATNTITEDIATGMLIESNGYKCIAISDIEAYGVAVNDLDSFAKQRSRWSRGCVQVFKNYKIIGNKGLNFRQKLDYISSIMYWFYGLKRILYLIIPLLFTLFGIMVIDSNLIMFISIFFTQYLIKRVSIDILEENERSSTWNKIYELALAPFIMKEVLKEFFGFGSTKFEVTSKKNECNKLTKIGKKILYCHLFFLFLSIVGIAFSIYKITILGFNVYILSIIWLLINIFYLVIIIIFDLNIKMNYVYGFIPNKTEVYKSKSYINIFTNLFRK